MKIDIKEAEATCVTKKVVGTQINGDLYEKLKRESEKAFMSISDLLRKIIYLYYNSEN